MTKIEDLKKLLADEWHRSRKLDTLANLSEAVLKAQLRDESLTVDMTKVKHASLLVGLYQRQCALRSVLDYVLEVLAEISRPYYEKRRLGPKAKDGGE